MNSNWHPVGFYKYDQFLTPGQRTLIESVVNAPISLDELVMRYNALLTDARTNPLGHALEDDWQHFLSYSGLRNETIDVLEKMRRAFEAAWEPATHAGSYGAGR